ncbi:MAG: NUDIX hydrolase [Burkholderiales bacterium]|nr:NUDIX hydrolase [Burkholderiales bacterium]
MTVDPRPSVTVAAVIERGGQFLLVEEEDEGRLVYNQPAGHLEQHESLVAGCRREVLEESAWHFQPRELVGIYRWRKPDSASGAGVTYLRFAFCGELGGHESGRRLDEGIVRAVWLHAEEIRASRERHRSPLVLHCVEDYLAGRRYPLDVLIDYA